MSCELLDAGLEPANPTAENISFDTRLCLDLSEGLHAMAQPLTILYGALWAASTKASNSAEQQNQLDMSVKQVTRLGGMLQTLRDLLAAGRGEPYRATLDVAELVGDTIDEMEDALRELGVRVEAPGTELSLAMDADADRTRRALRAAIRAMFPSMQRGGILRFSAHRENGAIQLELLYVAQASERQGNPDRLNLSAAETNIVSQGGTFCFVSEPLCITFTLPAARGTSPNHACTQNCAMVA